MGSIWAFALAITTAALAAPAYGRSDLSSLRPVRVAEVGQPVPGADARDRLLLANEPGTNAGIVLDFDLASIKAEATPLARLLLPEVEKLKVQRAGASATAERAALHVFVVDSNGAETLAGSTYVKPGGLLSRYVLDVTDAVNGALARPAGARKIRLAVRLTGKPIPFEVYALEAGKPTLELASAAGWQNDWNQRLAPIVTGTVVYHESCLPLSETRNADVPLRLLYPAKRVREVVALGNAEPLHEGRDWVLRHGQVVLPAGSRAPVQLASDFFLTPRKDKDGREMLVHSTIKLVNGPWYHERQIEVTYEPAARDWRWPKPISSLDDLPRTRQRLLGQQPLTVILFGDSISEGYNSSRLDAVWPYQPWYGQLVVWKLEQVYGSKITFMNHARAGDTAAHAVIVADAQVAWFKPDLVLLAYGMNDRGAARLPAERANLERIIDIVRARSPQTEFVVITPMLNNPKQPTGLDPIRAIRDQELAIDRPGVAFVDVTGAELALLERKDYLDLSGNGANHPNDFLHRVYAQRVLEVLAPGR